MADENNAVSNCTSGNRRKWPKTVPPLDQIDNLGYCLHPDGDINPHEPPSAFTEYQSRYCEFNLETGKQFDLSPSERNRKLELMDKLSTVQQRSYTNPYDSHFPLLRSKAVKPPLDRSKEAYLKCFKMNGWTEYQGTYDRCDRHKKIV